jgi:hypothetical protein
MKENNDWSVTYNTIISYSSPKATDLNGDGIEDIVMGAGGEEWSATEAGVIAMDGANGEIIWTVPADNQIYGSATFIKINNDDIPDVIIGGRSAQLKAIDGKTGKVIWSFFDGRGQNASKRAGWYNFSNAQIVLDQDGDKINDFIIANGGDATLPAELKDRPAGKLLLISSVTGKILAEDKMPDGRETYLSPVCLDCASNPNPKFIFGSGGETISGHLYITNLEKLKSKNLKESVIIDSTTTKGYEAPPVLIDINNDGVDDFVFNTSEGSTKVIDGENYKLIWSVKCDSAEVFSQPGVGNFYGNDNIPDIFVSYAKGAHPRYNGTEQWLIDGKNGKVVWKEKGRRFTYSSPLVADVNKDGIDEIIMNTVEDSIIGNDMKPYYELKVYDFKNIKTFNIGKRWNGACFGSTPLMQDLDHDGFIDLIYSGSPAIVSEFPGKSTFLMPPLSISIHREKLNLPISHVKWGSYMENKYAIK